MVLLCNKLARRFASMIAVNSRLPETTFQTVSVEKSGACSTPFNVSSSQLFKGKKVVLVSIPGAFTPVCSSQHVPGFIEKYDKLKEKGVDVVACTAVNDAFVLGAWGEKLNAKDKITWLADGSGKFAKAIGAEIDLSEKGMGVRGKRFAMLVEDGVVKYVGVDEGKLDKSSVDAVLGQL
jgi:peroxiredoxin